MGHLVSFPNTVTQEDKNMVTNLCCSMIKVLSRLKFGVIWLEWSLIPSKWVESNQGRPAKTLRESAYLFLLHRYKAMALHSSVVILSKIQAEWGVYCFACSNREAKVGDGFWDGDVLCSPEWSLSLEGQGPERQIELYSPHTNRQQLAALGGSNQGSVFQHCF